MEVAATISDILSENLRIVALPKDLEAVSHVIIKRKEVNKMGTPKKGVQMSKNVNLENIGWRTIWLSEDEMAETHDRVRTQNLEIMAQCIQDVEQFGKLTPTNKARVVVALYERVAISSYSAYQEALTKKINRVRMAAKNAEQESQELKDADQGFKETSSEQ